MMTKGVGLKILLEKEIPKIKDPIRSLEQYTTPSELVLEMIEHSYLSGILNNSTTMDLGAGTCRIAIASLIMGATKSIAIDIDNRFSSECLRSASKLGLKDRLLFLNAHIKNGVGLVREKGIDIVFMNPPFGVWNKGADREFLIFSFSRSPRRIYSILKSGNISYHTKLSSKWGYELKLIATREFPIPASMPHHKSRMKKVKVDVVLFER